MKRKIGRVDIANFPLLKLLDIQIKVDTGAYTSTIHCEEVVIEDGFLKVVFLDKLHPGYNKKQFIFDEYDVKVVKSSNGKAEPRYRIKTEVLLFGKTHPIYLTLSNRGTMKYPVLIGRKFLTKKFMVDINKTNLSQKIKLKKVKEIKVKK